MLEFNPWIPTSCNSCLCPWSWGATEPGQYRRLVAWTQARLYSNSADHSDWPVHHQIDMLRWSFTCSDTGADPYLIISCEGRLIKSTIKTDTLQPEFTTSAIFYRKKPRKPITVEVRWLWLISVTVQLPSCGTHPPTKCQLFKLSKPALF